MRNIMFKAAAVAFVLSGVLCATLAANAAQPTPEGQTRMQACSAEWKAEKAKPDYVKPEKGKGREAWNTFRTACIAKYEKPTRK